MFSPKTELYIHIKRRESILRSTVDIGTELNEQFDDIELSGQAGNVQRRIAFLSGRVHVRTPLEKLFHHMHVTFFTR